MKTTIAILVFMAALSVTIETTIFDNKNIPDFNTICSMSDPTGGLGGGGTQIPPPQA